MQHDWGVSKNVYSFVTSFMDDPLLDRRLRAERVEVQETDFLDLLAIFFDRPNRQGHRRSAFQICKINKFLHKHFLTREK